jgi:hypothetical protein
MPFSERFLAGFALAATIAKDPGAAAARGGLAEAVADAITQTAGELLALGKPARRARIRALTEPPPHTLAVPSSGPRRALALLVRQRGPGAAPAWLYDLPLPRPGYRPEPRLSALLARIASRMQKAVE